MAGLGEGGGQVLGGGDGERVDDAAAGQLPQVREQPTEPSLGSHARQDPEPQRRTREPAADGANLPMRVCRGADLLPAILYPAALVHPAELAFHIRDNAGVRGGRGGEHRSARREGSQKVADASIVGAEVVAPVADAVGLIDDEQARPGSEVGQLLRAERGIVEPLGAHQEDVDLIVGQGLAHLGPVEGVRRIHRHRADPRPGRCGDLVTHEGQQRRDDDRRPRSVGPQQRRRDEVDRRLAPSRALDDQHPLAIPDERENRLQLSLVEVDILASHESPQRRPRVTFQIAVHTRHRMPPRRQRPTLPAPPEIAEIVVELVDESVGTPGSVPQQPFPAAAATVIHLGRPLLAGSSALPADSGGPPSNACCSSLLRVGFTEPTWSPRSLVVSYTTVSPLPREPADRHTRRSVFCGTVPRITPGGR